jgi:protease I
LLFYIRQQAQLIPFWILRCSLLRWVDREVVVDNGLISSRNPNDIPAFINKAIEEFGEGQHEQQRRSA